MPHADLKMVRGSLVGNVRCQDELILRLQTVPRVLAFRNAKLGGRLNRSELEELALEVVSLIWAKLADFEGKSSFDGWVYRFCVLTLLSYQRKRRRLPVLLTEADDPAVEAQPERDIFQYERIDRSLEDLAPATRQIIRLKHYEDLTFEEIGELLSLSRNTVKTRYYRGLFKLRKLLGEPVPKAERQA